MGKIWFALLIIIDQLFKLIVINNNKLVIINGIVTLGFYVNYKPNYNYELLIVLLLLNIIIVPVIKRLSSSFGPFLVITGVISNSIDIFLRGFVVDWINIFSLPIFNLADLYLLVGIFIMLRYMLKRKQGVT